MEIDQEDHLYTSFFACTTKMLRSYVRTPFLRHARFGSFIPFEIFEVSRRNTHPRGLTTIHLSKSSKLRLKLDLRRFLGCPPHNVVRCGGADHRQLFVAVKPFVNHFFFVVCFTSTPETLSARDTPPHRPDPSLLQGTTQILGRAQALRPGHNHLSAVAGPVLARTPTRVKPPYQFAHFTVRYPDL